VEGAYGEEAPQLVPPLVSLANASHDHEEARDLLERALRIAERQPEPDEHVLATIQGNLARTGRGAEDLDRALADARQAVATAERAYGPDHPRLVALLDSLAERLTSVGDLSGALAVGERAIDMQAASDPRDIQMVQVLMTIWNAMVDCRCKP
jgi:uncharacterized membrane protein YccC